MLGQQYIPTLPPATPHVPPGATLLPLHPITLWPVGSIPNVLCFPGEIDPERFKQAVRRTVQIWPNVAGRYVRRPKADGTGYDFMIELTGSPIPFETHEIFSDQALVSDPVIQRTLEPFLPKLSPLFTRPNTDCPLLAIKLTTLLPSRRSVLGVNFAHILGDGATCNRFLSHLSFFYAEGARAVLPESDYPTFMFHIKLPVYPPEKEAVKRWDSRYFAPRTMIEMREEYGGDRAENEMMTLRLTRAEVARIKAKASERCAAGISTQDALSGWWVSLLRRSGTSIEKVINSVNYRHLAGAHPGFPHNLSTLAANVAQMRTTSMPPPKPDVLDDMAATATELRKSLTEVAQNHEETLEWLSVAADRLEYAASNDMAQCLVLPPDEAMINSNLRYDWAIPFGFPPDQVAYHTTVSLSRFLRVFQANPIQGQKLDEVDVELTFSVGKDGTQRAQIERLVAADRGGWMA